VEYDQTTRDGYLRFATREEAEAFMDKVFDKEFKSGLPALSQSGNVFMKEGREKPEIKILRGKQL